MLSRFEILEEYAKCITDPKYAIRTYLKTFDKTFDNNRGGFVPFLLFPRQCEIIDSYELHRFCIIAKPRQSGVSTTTAAYIAVKVAFADMSNPDKVLILANKQVMAQEFLGKVKDFLTQMPRWVWGDEYYGTTEKEKKTIFMTDSKGHLRLPNKCEVKAVATSKDALRGFTPTMAIIDEAAFVENGDIVFNTAMSALGTGGKCTLISCVTDDTYIFTDKGIKQVKDFVNKDYTGGYYVPEYNVLGKDVLRSGNLFHNNGYVDTIKIDTVNTSLEGSRNHKLYAYKSDLKKYDWYKLEDLTTDDFIGVQHGMEIWGNNDDVSDFSPEINNKIKNVFTPTKITTDIAYFIGLYISEGSTYKKYDNGNHVGSMITITCGDDVSEAFNSIGLSFCCHDGIHYTSGSKHFVSFLEYLGFDVSKKATHKIIPSRLLEMSRENIIAMMQGIFDGDGFSRVDNGRIGIGLSSKEMINQIRIILNNFGILTEYQETITKPTLKVKVSSNSYRLNVGTKFSEVFYDKIGFRFIRKQVKRNSLKLHKAGEYDSHDFIPNGTDIIKELNNNGKLDRKLLKSLGININEYLRGKVKTTNINRFKMLKILEAINCADYDIISNNLRWVKIKSITHGKNETYDFSLPETGDKWCHSVIYNGILGHQTPNGLDSLYYATYQGALEKTNDFHIIEMRWYEDSRYNKDLRWHKLDGDDTVFIEEKDFTFASYEAKLKDGYKPTSSWYETMCRNMNNNQRMIAQELDVSFLGSGGNVIHDEFIKFHEDNYVTEPKFISGSEKEYWIWEEPIEGHEYILGADASRGDGEDSSTIVIIDFTTMEQVMEYKGKVQPDLLGEIIYEYGNLYKALTVVDIAGGMGVTTVLKLLDMGYKYLHYDDPKSKLLINKKQLTKLSSKDTDKIPGFNATSCRVAMIANLERCVRENIVKIRSRRLTGEMKTFVYRNGRADHMSGFHDDLLMALAMGLFVLEHSFKNLQKLDKQTKVMLDSWVVGAGSGVNDASAFIHKDKTGTKTIIDPNKQRLAFRNTQDPKGEYLWLFSGMI